MLNTINRYAGLAGLIVALIALFVAIGGVAGALPGKNSVNSGDVKKNSLKSIDLKNDGVTGADVKESTLKIPAGALPDKDVFGVSVNAAGAVIAATLPGTTADIQGAGAYSVTFPRSVQGCVPQSSTSTLGGGADFDSTASLAGPNTVEVEAGNGTQGYNVTVVC
jgi:hypothetical protein